MKEEFIKEYYKILCPEGFPTFLYKYLELEELKRLQYIGQFCGCDYALYHPLFFYSRYDHSIATALMTYHFTKDKTQTICALMHDIGTPTFSHCIDYLLGDAENQESAERDVFKILSRSKIFLNDLQEDQISLNALQYPEKYSIVENKKPKICVDRLEGVLHTTLIWLHTHSLDTVRKIYQDITILENEEYKKELGFKNIETANIFFEMVYSYAIELQSGKNRYTMQWISDALKILLENKIFTMEYLYQAKESDILKLMQKHIPEWEIFTKIQDIEDSDTKPNYYFVSVTAKKRYCIPLCLQNHTTERLDQISTTCKNLLDKYLHYSTNHYIFSNQIKSLHFQK